MVGARIRRETNRAPTRHPNPTSPGLGWHRRSESTPGDAAAWCRRGRRATNARCTTGQSYLNKRRWRWSVAVKGINTANCMDLTTQKKKKKKKKKKRAHFPSFSAACCISGVRREASRWRRAAGLVRSPETSATTRQRQTREEIFIILHNYFDCGFASGRGAL